MPSWSSGSGSRTTSTPVAETKSNGAQTAHRELARCGLLMLADARLSSLTTLIAGGPVKGSWWSHPRGKEIFAASNALAERDDVLALKLVAGKVTFVHRKLWPSLFAVATAGDEWQTKGLSARARALLAKLRADSPLRCDDKATTAAARDLEERLLAPTTQVHTASGAHALQVESWERWSARVGLKEPIPALGDAKRELELAITALGAADAQSLVPWRARKH
jgi:hypothetical protein